MRGLYGALLCVTYLNNLGIGITKMSHITHVKNNHSYRKCTLALSRPYLVHTIVSCKLIKNVFCTFREVGVPSPLLFLLCNMIRMGFPLSSEMQ